MTLYFINGSKQSKELVESDYAEDIIDTIIDFFESHNRFPHIMTVDRNDSDLEIAMANTTEHFLITEVQEEDEIVIREGLSEM